MKSEIVRRDIRIWGAQGVKIKGGVNRIFQENTVGTGNGFCDKL